MKKLILILLLIPNLVMAETWVCSYLHQGEIETSVYERVGNEFHWKINDELTSKYEIWYEDALRIKLIDSRKDEIGIEAKLLSKVNPKFSSVHLYSTDAGVWSGDCEVVE